MNRLYSVLLVMAGLCASLTIGAQCDWAVDGEIYCSDPLGTAGDPTDDVYFVRVFLSNTSESTGWVASNGQEGSYNEAAELGPFPTSSPLIELEFSDNNNPNCTYTAQWIGQACLPQCAPTVVFTENECVDTPDGPQLYATFVYSAQDDSGSWQAQTSLGFISGADNEPYTFGPLQPDGGPSIFRIQGAEDPSCGIHVYIDPSVCLP